jgi:putative nucleotidyltransferase with HDIG domain
MFGISGLAKRPTTGQRAQPPERRPPDMSMLEERRVTIVRLLVLSCIPPLLWWNVIPPSSQPALTGLTVLIASYILAIVFLLPRLRIRPRQDLFLTIDILAAAALVYFTGGVTSSLLFLLYLPMLAAVMRFDLRNAVLSSTAVSAIVVWMWSMSEGGLPALGPVASRVGLFTGGSFLLAMFFATLAHETRQSATRHRFNIELALAYDSTLEGWARALDLRDNETEGHTQRVAQLTVRLAHAMGLRDTDLVQMRRGALLHDIGKLAVPDSIMLKPGALTDEQVEIMHRHPDYAQELLSPIAYLHPALDIPYCHHEKWDGTGYPRGLQGEEIPLAARIFAVVDVWDALRSDRPYRAAWTEEHAKTHIQEQAGTHFDPQVVAAFLKMLTAS